MDYNAYTYMSATTRTTKQSTMATQKKTANAKPAKETDDAFVSDDAISSGSGNYVGKLENGTSKFRIISMVILGWLEWIEDGEKKKPVRSKIDEQPETTDDENPPKKFMAMVVIDRKDGQAKIWEITQQGIIKKIKALTADKDWGKPFSYDIAVTKAGEGLKTKYEVNPCPKKPLEKQLQIDAAEKPCNLDALYDGLDPWKEENHTDGITQYYFK